MHLNKQELRKQLRAARHGITAEPREKAAQALTKLVQNLPYFQTARNVALYWPADDEINTLPLLNMCLSQGKLCFLPVLCLGSKQSLDFAAYTPATPVIKNRYNIIEPDLNYTAPIPLLDLDIIFIPLVGFDSQGYRLGRGGGYYDATLANLKHIEQNKWPKLVGLGYEIQKVPALPLDEWDWRLNAVVTEAQIYNFN